MHYYTRRLTVVLAMGLVLTGCAAKSTPIPQVTPTPTIEPTDTPTDTPLATATPLPTATPVPTDTPTPTVGPSLTPVPAGGDPTTCTGWATYGPTFQQAATKVKFDVYCGVLPSGWHLQSLGWTTPKGSKGVVTVSYADKNNKLLVTVDEGQYCTDASASSYCISATDTALGSVSFGQLSGTSYQVAAGKYRTNVSNTGYGYRVTTTGISQASFAAISAAFVKVAKP